MHAFQESINQHSWLCYTCWDMLREFHRFYLNVEESHIHFETTLKIEPPENTETRRRTPNNVEAKSKDETMGIVVDDMSLAIKSETNIEESAMLDTTVVRCSSKPTTPQECSDPLDNSLPVKARTIIRGNKSCKVRRKCVKEVTLNEYTMRDDENETIGDDNSSSTEFPPADNKNSSDSDGLEPEETSIISHCKSKTKRNEFDEFLATNFNMTCSICTAPMPTFNELCKHFVKEHKVRGFVSCCNKKFFRRSVLVDHIHRHLNPEYFKCKDCGKIMADRRCLDLHVKIHESQEKTHFCDVCGKAFSRLSAVKNHKLLLHLSDEEKKFGCDQCGKL